MQATRRCGVERARRHRNAFREEVIDAGRQGLPAASRHGTLPIVGSHSRPRLGVDVNQFAEWGVDPYGVTPDEFGLTA
jgi:hypothetical protein